MSASGKTTLAKKIGKKHNLKVLSVDNYKVELYTKYGFINETEKNILNNAAKQIFIADMFKMARTGKNFIAEYPFDCQWQETFDLMCTQYAYKLIVINCNSTDFETIWKRRMNRDVYLRDERHKSLVANKYISEQEWEFANNKFDFKSKQKHEQDYNEGKYHKLQGDVNFTDLDFL